ncbi:MAG: hypothetical protein N0E52_22480 [Candidatus Thiodiazotropha endolucinida]|nr:hypothetical protein [Candidatus Thiodiazotropha endolucinida]
MHEIKLSYNNYLEGLLGLSDTNSVITKKRFTLLKTCKQDQLGTPHIQQGTRFVTDTTEKADDNY